MEQRLSPLAGIGYLFTACTACNALGIILTFSPVTVCSVYMHPADPLGMLATIRGDWGISHEKDQQIDGLLMWVPMCLIYLSAIFGQLARWFAAPAAFAHPNPENACVRRRPPLTASHRPPRRLERAPDRPPPAADLFPRRAGDGDDVPVLGLHHLLGRLRGRRRPLHRRARGLDFRNSS